MACHVRQGMGRHRSRRDQGDKGPSTKCSLLLCNRVSPDPAVGGVSEDHARPRRAHAGHMNLEFGGIGITVPSILNPY